MFGADHKVKVVATHIISHLMALPGIIYQGIFLKKNLNAPRPSEHPPVWGKKLTGFYGSIKLREK